MKRKLIALILAAAMLAALLSAACSKPEDGKQSDSQNETTAAPETSSEPQQGDETTPTPAPETEDPGTEAPETEPPATPAPAAPRVIQPMISIGSQNRQINDSLWIFSSFQYAFLEGDEAREYSRLASALGERAAYVEQRAATSLELLALKARSMASDDYAAYSFSQTAYIRRSDTVAFSVLYSSVSDFPEEVPEIFYADTFDTATGRRLALADVVNDPSAIPGVINEIMGQRNEDGFTLDASVDYSGYFSNPDCHDYAWTLDYNGISLFFNDMAFSIEDAWACSAFIPFSAYPEFVKAEYMTAPEEYAVAFPPYITCYFELAGKVTPVIVAAVDYDDDDYYYPTDIYVGCGNDTFEEPLDLDGFLPVLIHNANGDFLCIERSSYNDYAFFTVFNVTSGSLKNNADYPYRQYVRYSEDYSSADRMPIVDPSCCRLTNWTEVLSTAYASKTFSFGNDGAPVSDDKLYFVNSPWQMTLLQDLEVELTDENCADLGKLSMHAGDTFDYYATDGESIAVLKLSDGRLVKIKVIKTEYYENFVNGIDISELFDGLLFAS